MIQAASLPDLPLRTMRAPEAGAGPLARPPVDGDMAPLPGRASSDAVDVAARLTAEAGAAARELFGGREVHVATFKDENSGHYVIQVTDRLSGETVAQYPPEELLRLYAAVREQLSPLVAIET